MTENLKTVFDFRHLNDGKLVTTIIVARTRRSSTLYTVETPYASRDLHEQNVERVYRPLKNREKERARKARVLNTALRRKQIRAYKAAPGPFFTTQTSSSSEL